MPHYDYRFVRASTGRLNKGRKEAFDESELLEILRGEGIEPIEIVANPTPPATEAQLAYLRGLGVAIDGSLNIREASDLIDNAKYSRKPAGSPESDLARRYRVETTRFTSKAEIYRRLLWKVTNDDQALAQWFVYRVYRSSFDRRQAGVSDPDLPEFRRIGMALAMDPQSIKSLRKAARGTSTQFRWFGNYRGYEGDSMRTHAYTFARRELAQVGLVPSAEGSPRSVSKPFSSLDFERESSWAVGQSFPKSERAGCFGSFLFFVALNVASLIAIYSSRWTE